MLLFLIFTLIFVLTFYNFYWKRRNLPPGPIPLPLFGNTLTLLRKKVYEPQLEWHRKYGPIHTLWMAELPVVLISDIGLINELFVKDGDAYAGRFYVEVALTQNLGGRYGVINTEGDIWREQRRFTLQVFRDFGMGKNLMQERVLDEVACLIEKVKKDIKNGANEHNLAQHIDVAVGSIINNLLFNYRFDEDHIHEFYELKRLVSDLMHHAGYPLLIVFRSYLQYIPIINKHFFALQDSKKALYDFYKHQVEEHQRRIDHDSEPTDYVDAYLREKAKREAETGVEDPNFSMIQLLNMLGDLWLAGQETTSTTLAWGMIYLMLDQKIQSRLQKELDMVIGSDRLISLDDKPKLHYTNAVVNEIQRIANLLPFNVPHTTTKDVEIHGYKLKKGSIITPHITAVLYDEKVFPNPHKFDPERFLDANGNWKKIEELVPFSVGKRQCLGIGLAQMELFLFVANIFNQFKITSIPSKPPSLERKLGGTIVPEPFVCHVENR